VARARLEVGARRVATLAGALEVAARGPYLEPLDDESALGRRRHLADVAQEARLEYARAARAAGSSRQALEVLSEVVREDPYREDAWQEMMRTQAVVSGPTAVVQVFLDCQRALEHVRLKPSRDTRLLLERLRG
jgi:DNA-binding SARP family transcriptional activator